LTVFE